MRDDRERWMLGTSYHKVMENYLGVTLIRSGWRRYRPMKQQRFYMINTLNKGGTA